jgi:NAD(P)-dependent dehydrogenase (short-subunit alcohol dehydrogenase family)
MDLDGKVFVVPGGAGTAGECVVAAFLRHGATVAVTSRSAERLDRLRGSIRSPRLHTYRAQLGDLSESVAVRDRMIAELGPLDGVVAALGGWWEGSRLTELDAGTWRAIVESNLTSHFLAARTYLPVLADRPGAVYIALAGIAALKPVPGSGPISVTGAAQTMLLRVLAAELADRPVRLHEIAILTPIVTRHWDGSPIEEGWLTGEEVGEYVARVAAPDFSGPDQLLLAQPASFLPAPLTFHSPEPA